MSANSISDLSRNDAQLSDIVAHDGDCTIYFRGGLGMVAIRCKRAEVKAGSYAQYSNALFVQYRECRKRKDRGMVQTSFPSVLIVEGHATPDPAASMVEVNETISRSRYSSCDPRWQTDFDAMLAPLIASGSLRVIFDGRQNNPYARTV